ncbi:hypothetical protein GW17_00057313 [Ensete ventricosum]|nr:hypothetical protein GW17_00057313 [Ensete ventricosum]RZS23944.1 hypothetical protein BHM03_00056952 [Ensete ventricosum]
MGLFPPHYHPKSTSTVDFDHRRPISSSISKGREKKKEKKNMETTLLFACTIRRHGRFLLPARGEETSPPVERRNETTVSLLNME